MSSIVISGDTSGAITLAAPAVSGTNTVTMPAATGVCMVSGNMPAFSAYQSSAQTGLTANTYTKVQFQTKEFDTASCFDATTNYRFTPTVAGYYQVTAQVGFNTSMNYGVVSIYKNGSNFKAASAQQTYALSVICNSLIYLNGSTDYIEIYVYPSATLSVVANSQSTFFQASLVRAA